MFLYKMLDKTVKENPDKKAVICGEKSCSYKELADKMDLWAKTLLSLGVKRGDRVALFMKNSVELVQLYFACFRVGAIAVPVNTRYRTPEAVYAVGHSGSKILIASSELYPIVKDLKKQIASLEDIYIIDDDAGDGSELWSSAVAKADHKINFPKLEMSDPVIIIYTSGSTGRPKGAVHTNYSLYNHLLQKTTTQEMDRSEVSLAATQISHIAGFGAILLPTLYVGGTAILEKEFEAGDYINYLKRYRPTYFVLLPTELLEILEHPNSKDADFSNVRFMLIAGDRVSHHIYELFRNLTGSDLMEGCGMTECEGYCVQPKHEPKKPGSIGKPISGVQMRLVGKDGRDVDEGKTGEILIKSKSLIACYWDDPEATMKAFEDGWFHTGDLAYRDSDAYYHFAGRIKEIIIRGGSNISPGDVEDVLNEHPLVEMSGVVGFPDEHYGSIVGAYVEPKRGVPAPTVEELSAFAAKSLAQYKVPEKWIFMENLPKNAVGKIDRKKLHELVKSASSGKT